MNFQKELQRYMSDLQEFDLEVFFHDETFLDMLAYRRSMEKNIKKLTIEEQKELFYLDEIVLSYFHLYSNKTLERYGQLSFKLLEKVAKIAQKYVSEHSDIAA
jgi:hypothetical protein